MRPEVPQGGDDRPEDPREDRPDDRPHDQREDRLEGRPHEQYEKQPKDRPHEQREKQPEDRPDELSLSLSQLSKTAPLLDPVVAQRTRLRARRLLLGPGSRFVAGPLPAPLRLFLAQVLLPASLVATVGIYLGWAVQAAQALYP